MATESENPQREAAKRT
jgi:hypothetical protein